MGSAALLWSHSYYHTPTFEKILKKHCGEMPLITHARDPTLPRVSAISTVVNQERVCPYVFRTYALPPMQRPKVWFMVMHNHNYGYNILVLFSHYAP